MGSQLVLFPEVFVGGFPRGSTFGAVIGTGGPGLAKGKEDYRKYFASAIDVPGLQLAITRRWQPSSWRTQ
jgi:hypothetical protein